MKLLLDENLSPRHAITLSAVGHDAVSVVDVHLSGASDKTIRETAIQKNRILVTLDADFGNIIRFSPAGTPGVIWLRLSPPTEAAIAKALDRAVKTLADVDLTGKLAVVDEDKIRVRAA